MAAESVGPTDAAGSSDPVTLINVFTLPAKESERFLGSWRERARVMAGRPGFVRARMYRSLDDTGEPRFFNVAEWASERALAEALADAAWRASAQRMLDDPDLHVTARPTVCRLAVDLRPEAGS